MDELERPAPPPASSDDAALRAAGSLARWLDGRHVDPLLGLLLPGFGDLLSAGLGMYPVVLAWRRRAPKALVARMILNLAADAAGGSIPIVGDIWDFFFKAHARNHELLRSRLHAGGAKGSAADTLVIVAALLVLLVALALPIFIAVAAVSWLAGKLGS